MTMAASQGGANNGGGEGGAAGAGEGNQDGGAGNGEGGQGGSQQQQQQNNASSQQFDATTLTQEQINEVLEKNPLIWKADRIAGLREKAGKFDEAQTEAQKAEEKRLQDEGKFKELAEKQTGTITELQAQLKQTNVNTQLMQKLTPLGVVDLEGALKLVDRSKIEVSDDGTIKGVDEAIESLKTDKAYLFSGNGEGNQSLGTGNNNGGNGGEGNGAPAKFKRSQLADPAFYKQNEAAILEAYKNGQIEDDIS